MPQAASLADAIRQETGCSPEMLEGNRGVFDIRKDGVLIYSKHDSGGQFPVPQQIIEALRL